MATITVTTATDLVASDGLRSLREAGELAPAELEAPTRSSSRPRSRARP